jgi:hypothetical protein
MKGLENKKPPKSGLLQLFSLFLPVRVKIRELREVPPERFELSL